jgi:hypothetical protein
VLLVMFAERAIEKTRAKRPTPAKRRQYHRHTDGRE